MRRSFVDALAEAIVRQLAASARGSSLATRRRFPSGNHPAISQASKSAWSGGTGLAASMGSPALVREIEQIASAIVARLSTGEPDNELPLETIEI